MSIVYSINHLFKFVDLSIQEPKPTLASMNAYWMALIRWLQGQLIFDRKILIPNFGFVIPLLIQQTKVIGIQILPKFLKKQQIRCRDQFNQSTKPIINLHYVAIGKMLEKNQQPELLQKFYNQFFKIILNIIKENNTSIDLGILGKIIIHEKVLSFQPYITYKKKHQGRTTVSQIMVNKENSFRIKTKINESQHLSTNKSSILAHSLSPLGQSLFSHNPKLQGLQLSPTLGTESRKYMKSDFTKYLDMLGQISDPIGRGYNFSQLAKEPHQLLATTFTKTDYCKPRYPPILDKSIHTIAASITNQRYNLSISGRIACNYNQLARSLYFDEFSRCIQKFIPAQGIKFKAQPILLEVPATDSEQLEYLTTNKTQYQRKVDARRKCFERYNQYIEKELPHTLVAPIDKSQIKRILDKACVNKDTAKDGNLRDIVDSSLATIVKNYYYSGRKTILDYILKDEQERQRIGIVEILKQPPTWGSFFTKQISFKASSIKYIKKSKQLIGQNLLLPGCTVLIKEGWVDYQNQLFINIPTKQSATNLLYFIKKQQQRISEIRVNLRGKWYQSVVDLVKQDIKKLKQKDKISTLCRTVNTLMSNLIRQLIQKSLFKYLQFFQQYRKSEYYSVEQLLKNNQIIQNAFLMVKLRDQGQNIVFAENLMSILKPELLNVLEAVIKQSKQFPCILLKDKKLWEMSIDSDYYTFCYNKIEQIINSNIQNVERATLVYKKYQYLLRRNAEVAEWCNEQHSIQQYIDIIEQTKKLSSRIMVELPFTIRMNMILVDGTDLKKRFITILSQVENQLNRSIYENIKRFYAQIKEKIEGVKIALKPKVDSTLKLLEIESEIFRARKVQVPQIKLSFNNLKKWMNLLFSQGSPLLVQSDLMQVYLISQSIFSIGEHISSQQNRVFLQKEEIQKILKKQSSHFCENIKKLAKQLENMIQQFTIRKQFSNYNRLLKQFGAKYKQCISTKVSINLQEEHLGWIPTKFSQIEQISKSLDPLTDFWSMIAVVDVQLKDWKAQPVKNLIAEDLQIALQTNMNQLQRLIQSQSGNYYLSYKVLTQVRNELIDMSQKYLPLIRIFANKGLKQRHWQAFAKQFSICQNKQTLTLNKMISYKVADEYDKIDILLQISEYATKQFDIEKTKSKMVQQWYPLTLTFKQFNKTGIIIVSSQINSFYDLLQQQLQKTRGLKQLQQARIFEPNLIEWQLWLKYTQSLFLQWMKAQSYVCYLSPIFSDEQIIKNFPLEQSEFQGIINSWKSIMRRIQQQPRIVEFTKNKKMLDIFLQCNIKLSAMESTISTFLKQKNH